MKNLIILSGPVRLRVLIVVTGAVLAAFPSSTDAQCTPPQHRVWVQCADNGSGNDTVWFGWEYGATPGCDEWLCECVELPPSPPAGVFDVRLIPVHPGADSTRSQGDQVDYRPYDPGGIDTFRVKFQPGEGGFPFSFSWDTAMVSAAYDSCIMQDEFGGFLVRAQMHRVGSVRVTNPAFTSLLILGWQRIPQGTPPPTRMRLQISDAGTGIDNLWMGYDPTARLAIDLHLSEFEVPVMPPSGVFFTLFKNPPGHEGADTSEGLGMGSFSDYRAHRSEAAIDTHRIHFQPGDSGYPMSVRWSMDCVRAICDSAVILDGFGGLFYRKRMDMDSVLTVTDQALTSLLVIRYGQSPLVHVVNGGGTPDPGFMVVQNYPNPFNPVTTVRFSIPGSAGPWPAPARPSDGTGGRRPGTAHATSLRVYDILGREVAVLVNEMQQPGEYSVVFDGGGLPSGVYVAVLRAGGRVATMKMLMVR
jgi:hypothetical protein